MFIQILFIQRKSKSITKRNKGEEKEKKEKRREEEIKINKRKKERNRKQVPSLMRNNCNAKKCPKRKQSIAAQFIAFRLLYANVVKTELHYRKNACKKIR